MAADASPTSTNPETGRLAAADGLRLVYTLHRAENARAGMVVTHGYAEHRGRYGYLVEAMVASGISVLTWDARGHGDSGGTRGLVGRFDEYLDDFAVIMRFARQVLPRPLIAFGHSMGGLIVTRFYQERSLPVDGLVLSNPALQLSMVVPGWKLTAVKLLARLLPAFSLPSDIPPELISRDPQEIARYRDDKVVFGHATARWAREFMATQRDTLLRPADLAALPVLVLLSTGDGIIDWAVSQDFYGRCMAADCEIKTYAGHYHELINEGPAHRELVFADVRQWIDQRISALG
jgi:alpha-beta hydrolase superfamily lysophospholipase